MEAIRRIVLVRDNKVTVELPEGYNNKAVELIILKAAEEPAENVSEPKVDFDAMYGSLKSGLTIEQIDAELKALRNEWERDI